MLTKRIIPCLDVHNGRVVKGVNFVNLRDAGDPVEIAAAYDRAGADELVFLDITASSDARNTVVDMVRRVTARFPNVEVDFSDKLLSEYAESKGAHVVVKGLRAMSDFEKEFQMAHINRRLNPALDTMFLTATEKYTFLSSSVVKELAAYGANLKELVPREIIDEIEAKMQQRKEEKHGDRH